MKQITLIASIANERFKGGIYTIAHGLISREDLFQKQGYTLKGVSSCQLPSRSIENVGKFKLENIRNVITVIIAIWKNEKAKESAIFYGITSTGLGFLKDVIIFSLLKIRWTSKKTILNIQFTGIDEILPKIVILKRLSILLTNRFIDTLIVPNAETKEDFAGIGYKKAITIQSNFFVGYKEVVPITQRNQDKLKLLYLGMMDERKGFHRILELLTSLKEENVELHVCGDYLSGDFREKMEVYIQENQLESKIVFHGFVSGIAKQNILSSCDVFVLLTSGEGMAMALLEAMHSGLAVLTTNITSNKEVFEELNYTLFDLNVKSAMLVTLRSYLGDSDRLYRDKETCASVVQRFSIENHINSLVEVFRDQIKN